MNFSTFEEKAGLLYPKFDADAVRNNERERKLAVLLVENNLLPCLGNGMFDTDQSKELFEFTKKYPFYHIVSELDAEGSKTLFQNGLCFFNRLAYYLADGDSDGELFAISS